MVDFEFMAVALLLLRNTNNSPLPLQMEVMCANLEKHPKSFPMINLTYPGVCVCVSLCIAIQLCGSQHECFCFLHCIAFGNRHINLSFALSCP